MKTFIITLPNNPHSVKSTQQAIKSARDVGYGETIEHFNGINPGEWVDILPHDNSFQAYNRPDNVGACFASHYLLWKKCVELNEPILILEHDAIFVENMPDIDFNMCITFGRPSYIRPDYLFFKEPIEGVQPLTQHNFLGHHAYALKPEAAKIFIKDVEERVLSANDVWIDTYTYTWLQEYRPFPIIADTEFSTIQLDRPISKYNTKKAPIVRLSPIVGFRKKYPDLSCWKAGTVENRYILDHFSHVLYHPQSKRFIETESGSVNII